MYLHIVVTESGDTFAPVLVKYEVICFMGQHWRGTITQEQLCLNDDWLSPVTIVRTARGERPVPLFKGTIERPDKASTAGKAAIVLESGEKIVRDVKARSILTFSPLEIVRRMPFDQDKCVTFTLLGPEWMYSFDCQLGYKGEEDTEVTGEKVRLHKFVLVAGKEQPVTYWLNAKSEVVAMDDLVVLTPGEVGKVNKAIDDAESKFGK